MNPEWGYSYHVLDEITYSKNPIILKKLINRPLVKNFINDYGVPKAIHPEPVEYAQKRMEIFI